MLEKVRNVRNGHMVVGSASSLVAPNLLRVLGEDTRDVFPEIPGWPGSGEPAWELRGRHTFVCHHQRTHTAAVVLRLKVLKGLLI